MAVAKRFQDGIKSSESSNAIQAHYANLLISTDQDSSYDPATFEKPYNRDELYKKKGDYSIYESMMVDDQVKAASKLKKDIILGSGFEIITEDQGQEAIQEDLEIALNEDIECPFEESLEEIMSSYDYGFSLTEKIFKKRDDGSLTIGQLLTRHPATWEIHQDAKGVVTDYKQHTRDGLQSIKARSLIHLVNDRKFQNPYGTSDLRSAYTAWFTKLEIVKYYAIFFGKSASPTPVARYDKAAPAEAVDKIHAAIQKFQTKSAITIPKEIEIEFIEAKNDGQVFENGINLFNMFIGRALMIPDLMGFSGSETDGGSFSLGENQMDVFFKHINRRRKAIEKIVDIHILKPIVVWNHGFVPKFPKFRFKPIKDQDGKELAKIFIEAVKGKFYKASDEEINHLRSLIQFPEGDVEREEPVETDAMGNPIPKAKSSKPGSKNLEEETKTKPDDEIQDKSQFAYYKPTDGDYGKKTNFKALESQLDSAHENFMAAAEPVLNSIFKKLAEQIESKKVLDHPDRAGELKLSNKRDLNILLKSAFKDHYEKNQTLAQAEILKSDYRTISIEDEFLEFLENETFQFVGDWEYRITQGARIEIIKAIKDGAPLSSVIDFVNDSTKEAARVSLERFSRTKFTEVMNRARLDFFGSTGVVAGYQFSAIMDGRTSQICAGLHGKKFKAGTQPIPPLHFNCRSTLIPITKYEEFEEDSRVGGQVTTARGDVISIPRNTIKDHITKNLGEGFSVR